MSRFIALEYVNIIVVFVVAREVERPPPSRCGWSGGSIIASRPAAVVTGEGRKEGRPRRIYMQRQLAQLSF